METISRQILVRYIHHKAVNAYYRGRKPERVVGRCESNYLRPMVPYLGVFSVISYPLIPYRSTCFCLGIFAISIRMEVIAKQIAFLSKETSGQPSKILTAVGAKGGSGQSQVRRSDLSFYQTHKFKK